MSKALVRYKSATAEDVNSELQRQWALLLTDEDTQELARQRGVDVDEILALSDDLPLVAEPEHEGNRSDVLTAILVKVAVSVGSKVVMTALEHAWKKMIEPQLKRRFGSGEEPPDAGA